MLTRRHLFRTLSAIAVAPLAKWLPKETRHPSLDAGVRFVEQPLMICCRDGMWVVTDNGDGTFGYRRVPTARVTVLEPFTVSGQLPTPQEEA